MKADESRQVYLFCHNYPLSVMTYTPEYLDVNGSIEYMGTIMGVSDIRLKDNKQDVDWLGLHEIKLPLVPNDIGTSASANRNF